MFEYFFVAAKRSNVNENELGTFCQDVGYHVSYDLVIGVLVSWDLMKCF